AGTLTVLDDSYNANPTSMEAGLEVLRRLPACGRRVAVLGEMRELGADTEALHAELGLAAARAGVDVLVAVGSYARHLADAARSAGLTNVTVAESAKAALAFLLRELRPHDVVMVKGSRLARMEIVVEGLLRAWTLGDVAGAPPTEPGIAQGATR